MQHPPIPAIATLWLVALLFLIPGTASAQNNAVKFTFLSWFSGSTKISYERAFGGKLRLICKAGVTDEFPHD